MINNRYQILQLLGEGGFGRTYLTEDTHMPSRRKCVVKELKSLDAHSQIQQLVVDRFQREAATLEDLGENHSQIPKLYAYFAESGQFYLVQELISGDPLQEVIAKQGLMGEQQARAILLDILDTLKFVHSRGIIHRDIKPDNIILRQHDRRPVLIDFGAVRETVGTVVNSQGQAVQSIVIGTPGYMASEQAVGKPLFSSDLYSLGLTIIYLLTGKNPSEFPLDGDTGRIHWRQFTPQISSNFADILDRAIQPYSRDRYMNVGQMSAALADGAAAPAPAYIPPQPHYPQPNNIPPTLPDYSAPAPAPQPQHQGTSSWVGGGGTFNTSAIVPPDIGGWNWGAFLMAPLWCINNQVWIGLLSWIPWVGFVMSIVVGAKGNTWAWRSRKWESKEAFKANQRAWTIAGLSVWGASIALIVLAVALVPEDKTQPQDSDSTRTENPELTSDNQPKKSSPPAKSSADLKTIPVEFGQMSKYTYKRNLFDISIPEKWTEEDKSDAEEVAVNWTDKSGNGAIIVNIFNNQDGESGKEELGIKLKSVIEKVYRPKLEQVKIDNPQNTDRGVTIAWRYIDKNKSGNTPITANSEILAEKDKLAIYTEIYPTEQSDRVRSRFQEIQSSFTVNPDAPVSESKQ
jgi:serine/threonine protein kinase